MSDSTQPLQWGETPNPRPSPQSKVTWTTRGGNGRAVLWKSYNEDVISLSSPYLDESGVSSVTLAVVGPGVALITATQVDSAMIGRFASVDELFAYGKKTDGDYSLWGIRSSDWIVQTDAQATNNRLPSFERMKSLGYCVAYVPDGSDPSLVLNLDSLTTLVRGLHRPAYFAATIDKPTSVQESPPTPASPFKTYAYAPDGTLWSFGSTWNDESLNPDLPPDFPGADALTSRGIALAWSPPPPVETAFCVTCFILNQDAFPKGSSTETTFYSLKQVR